MATQDRFYYVVRLNWLDPKSEGEFNRFYNEVIMPNALKRPGFVRGARYKIERGPEYEGWSGPSRAYQYLHVYELSDPTETLKTPVRPAGQMPHLQQWRGDKPLIEMINEVVMVYRRVLGQIDFPQLIYVTRLNVVGSPEKEQIWNDYYEKAVFPGALKRLGTGGGGRHIAAREPVYNGWTGPSRAYKYFNMFELLDHPGAPAEAMSPVGQLPSTQAWPHDWRIVSIVNAVRAVYRRFV